MRGPCSAPGGSLCQAAGGGQGNVLCGPPGGLQSGVACRLRFPNHPQYPELGNPDKRKRKGQAFRSSRNSLTNRIPPNTESYNLRSSEDWTTKDPDIYNATGRRT